MWDVYVKDRNKKSIQKFPIFVLLRQEVDWQWCHMTFTRLVWLVLLTKVMLEKLYQTENGLTSKQQDIKATWHQSDRTSKQCDVKATHQHSVTSSRCDIKAKMLKILEKRINKREKAFLCHARHFQRSSLSKLNILGFSWGKVDSSSTADKSVQLDV